MWRIPVTVILLLARESAMEVNPHLITLSDKEMLDKLA